MCGFCTEVFAFEFLERERLEKPFLFQGWPASEFVFQETKDPSYAMERFAASVRRKKQDLINELPDETLLCRAIDLLLEKGFDSEAYQQLSRKKIFKMLLNKTCPGEINTKDVTTMGRFTFNQLNRLYDSEIWTSKEAVTELLESVKIKKETLTALRYYIDWWLKGKGLKKNDLKKRMDETGILDPIEDISKNEQEVFRAIFRAVWFSVNFLRHSQESEKMLGEIVRNGPAGVPHFDAKDLWLQRRAALILFDISGLKPFLEQGCRASLLYYLHLKKGLSQEDFYSLSQALDRLGEDAFADDLFNFREWLAEVCKC